MAGWIMADRALNFVRRLLFLRKVVYYLLLLFVITARRYASAVYAVVVCPSQANAVPKWLNVALRKQRHRPWTLVC